MIKIANDSPSHSLSNLMLTPMQASKGVAHAYQSARNLFYAGQRHRRAGQHGIACAMYVLSTEESAKAFALSKRAEGISDGTELNAIFRKHVAKHEIASELVDMLHHMLILLGHEHHPGCDVLSRVSHWKQTADRLKQIGLYVDWVEGQWKLPTDISEEDVALTLFICKSVLAVAKTVSKQT